jgi:DNA polymerase III subunit gamma/tau
LSQVALARRYRPRRFAEVATQEHVSETLRRAVSGDRVGHAYLFCGPRGVGKTTLARVLAMALNCQDRDSEGEPCGQCESCTRIWSGNTSLDVVEIDAASNRGVDDARELRSRAMYAPSEEGRYKVYIVDEAHMLTREAWNALLKLLEEPPDRVIFIFATTEPEKIEQTAAPILSRCQRFDFRRVAVPEIVTRLQEVLEREGAEAPTDALRLIARKADGGMRDALSLTDQVLALSDGTGVSVEVVRRILGVVEEERFLQVLDLIADRDQAGIFQVVQELLDQGYDLVEFYHGLLDALRTLLRLRVGGSIPELPEERRGDWGERADRFAPGDLVRMLGMAAELETGGSMRRSSQPRILLELLLLRFSFLDRTLELESLLRGLGGEDPGMDGGGLRRPDDPVSPSPPARPASPSSPAGPSSSSSASTPSQTASSGTPSKGLDGSDLPGSSADVDQEEGLPPSEASAGGAVVDSEPTNARASGSGGGEGGAATSSSDGSAGRLPQRTPSPQPQEGRPSLTENWRAFLRSGEGIPPGLTPLLMGSRVTEGEGGDLILSLPPGPALERLEDPKELARLESAFSRVAGTDPGIRVEPMELNESTEESRVSRKEVRAGQLGDLLEKEPGLRGAVEAWDLDIVE